MAGGRSYANPRHLSTGLHSESAIAVVPLASGYRRGRLTCPGLLGSQISQQQQYIIFGLSVNER